MDEYQAGVASPRPARLRTPAFAVVAILVVGGGVALTVGTSSTDHGVEDLVPTCPDGEVVVTPPLEGVRVPAFDSPRDAALSWAGPGAGELAVSSDGKLAYLRREDGSVRARMHLDSTRVDLDDGEPTSWWVNGSESCSDEISDRPWEAPDPTSCAGGTVRAQVAYPPGGDRRLLTAGEGLDFADPRDDHVQLALTAGATSGDVTATVSGPDGPHTWLRQLRVDDSWRVHELVACARQLPGLPTTEVAQLVRLHVGHCWVEPLAHAGRRWELPLREQFGWGGELPPHWTGYGRVAVRGEGLRYVDAGGAELDLLPADDPRTELPGGGLCA